jgi:hypothetical protein
MSTPLTRHHVLTKLPADNISLLSGSTLPIHSYEASMQPARKRVTRPQDLQPKTLKPTLPSRISKTHPSRSSISSNIPRYCLASARPNGSEKHGISLQSTTDLLSAPQIANSSKNYYCEVCREDLDSSLFQNQQPTILCTHSERVCITCMQNWISQALERCGPTHIRCPICPLCLYHKDVRAQATSEAFER